MFCRAGFKSGLSWRRNLREAAVLALIAKHQNIGFKFAKLSTDFSDFATKSETYLAFYAYATPINRLPAWRLAPRALKCLMPDTVVIEHLSRRLLLSQRRSTGVNGSDLLRGTRVDSHAFAPSLEAGCVSTLEGFIQSTHRATALPTRSTSNSRVQEYHY